MNRRKPITSPLTQVIARANAWLKNYPELPESREVRRDLKEQRWSSLAESFSTDINFGTAGLRAKGGAGTARMNAVSVGRVTYALVQYLTRCDRDAQRRGVCVAFDARRASQRLAEVAANLLLAHGFTVHAFEKLAPTPLLAYAVGARAAVAGLMFTASHNPADYFGLKVFWQNGAQIHAPHDEGVAALLPPLELSLQPKEDVKGKRYAVDEDLTEAYLQRIVDLRWHVPRSCLRYAYTAVHGVGERITREAFQRTGFNALNSVASQAQPDPDFPTAPNPNPEHNQTLDALTQLFHLTSSDVAFAHDPDADRLRVGACDEDGQLRYFHGNDVGLLLADFSLRSAKVPKPILVTSFVSSPGLYRLCQSRGAIYSETRTGFKWIVKRGLELEEEYGGDFIFGYEEALGYALTSFVRDKDGITAAVAVARYAEDLHRGGATLWTRLRELWREVGVHLSGQVTVPLLQPFDETQAIEQLKPLASEEGLSLNMRLQPKGGRGGEVALINLTSSGTRILVRPSGTEPLLKCYVDVWTGAAQDTSDSERQLKEKRDHLMLACRTAFSTQPPI